MSRIWIPKVLPSYTDLMGHACAPKGPGRYATFKRKVEDFIGLLARSQRFEGEGRAWTYLFVERDERRDPSNVSSGAIKVIEDALRRCGAIRNDGWRDVRQIRPYFTTCKKLQGVMVWSTDEPLAEHDALLAVQEMIDGVKRNPTARDLYPTDDT